MSDINLVSVIMPSFNTGKYISESIKSVVNQTYTNWELIIVDDCSIDNTDEIVKRYLDDKRIKYFKNKENLGAAYSRNFALSKANGRWIAFLDSDDLWIKEKLEKQIHFMQANNYVFSYTNYEEIDENSLKRNVLVTGPKKITKLGMYNYCWPGCLTVMYDAEIIGKVHIININKNNDYAMWLKICKKADCYLLPEYLALYRKGRKGSISSNSIQTMIVWHYKMFRESEEQNVFLSAFNTFRNMIFGFYKKKKYVIKEK